MPPKTAKAPKLERFVQEVHSSLDFPAMLRATAAEFLTSDEAAKALGVSRFSLYTYVKEERLPAYKRGKKRFFKKEDVAALLVPQRIDPKPRKRKNTPVRSAARAKGR